MFLHGMIINAWYQMRAHLGYFRHLALSQPYLTWLALREIR